MSWHHEWCSENYEAIKQLAVYRDITIFFMKQYSFKNAEYSVQNNISTFCQVAYQHLQQNNEIFFLVFSYVVFIDFYGSSLCWQFYIFQIHCTCVLPYYVFTRCNQMCVSFFFSNFPDIYWILYLVKFR
jgi:hypothetical protein